MAVKKLLKTIRESDKNLAEAGLDLASELVKDTATAVTQAARDELSEDWRISMRQMLGLAERAGQDAQKLEGELEEGQEVSFAKEKAERQEKKAEVEPGIDYRREILQVEERHIRQENTEIRQRLEEIRVELVKIKESSKDLEATFKSVAVETLQTPVEAGTYHINFFEWLFSALQSARVRIESSASWLSTIVSKKSKKDYWALARKHGTSYSLSGERVVAQQTG